MTIFETRRPFRDEYQPDRIVARDETLSELVHAFQDLVDGYNIPYVLIHGDHGTGKRTLVRRVLNLAGNEIENEINTITVDCAEHDTLYKVSAELATRLSEENYGSGYSQRDLEQAIFQAMDDPGVTWYILLENLERLDDQHEPFQEFHEGIAKFGTDKTQCGIIGISNDPGVSQYPTREVRAQLNLQTVATDPYNNDELREILELHADAAFADDALCSDVIPKCAAIIAQETGRATEALQLLELAGYVAHQADADRVTGAHVQTATESREALYVFTEFRDDLTPNEQLILAILAAQTEVDEEPLHTKAVHAKYDEHYGEFNLNELKKRRVEQLIRNLRAKSLIDTEAHNDGQNGGIWNTHEAGVPPTLIFRAAIATSGRYKLFFRKYGVSIDQLPEPEVDVEEFLCQDWLSQASGPGSRRSGFGPQ